MDSLMRRRILLLRRAPGFHILPQCIRQDKNRQVRQEFTDLVESIKITEPGRQVTVRNNRFRRKKGFMQKITTHLWYDKEAKEAADFYLSIFKDSKHKDTTTIHNTPSGSVEIVTIELMGQQFTLLSAGPLFKFNPSISFLVSFETGEELDAAWKKLAEGGTALMELGTYPFAERYGWIQDKYGLSWQLIYSARRPIKRTITPTLMFVGRQYGRAEEAINHYASIFRKAQVDAILRYENNEEPDMAGTIKHASFTLEEQAFAAMDSAHGHNFAFTEAISLMVHCDTQMEIDYYWDMLTAFPEEEQCGWLKDKFGLSWQIVPTAMNKIFEEKDEKKIARVTEAFLRMKKFDLAKLREAADRV
jgi:predicted 3-demethylubiquinone-9 3-methyltransferase (glyoxalase superfamily)